ncbi:MAG: cobalt-precorrin-4/precorrin-4 C(11)-methyltransferase [Ardenticatenia bacterium]|nr:cobalt-precorrin-4/precorrin-4 C(11)-methyltransferase [Ardenticatenia bacterium]
MKPGTVYVVGAGPGAPDLITRRGQRLLERADLVIYADSLVDDRLVAPARARGARVVGSSGLTLEEIVELMATASQEGQVVVRLHSGDPSIYGAVHEQLVRLEAEGIPWEIVPGVPSFAAAAARLGVELTVPGVAQTIILTRTAGRTPMPGGESAWPTWPPTGPRWPST